MATILKCYKERTRKCVTGWIRELEKELPNESNVPTMIKEICIKYIKDIDNQNKICFCGSPFKNTSVYNRLKPVQYTSNNLSQLKFIECVFCDRCYFFEGNSLQYICGDGFKNILLIEEVSYCDKTSKLHPRAIHKCYPKCPHRSRECKQ